MKKIEKEYVQEQDFFELNLAEKNMIEIIEENVELQMEKE